MYESKKKLYQSNFERINEEDTNIIPPDQGIFQFLKNVRQIYNRKVMTLIAL